MKKVISILFLLLFAGAFFPVKAQDVITKKADGSEIRAKVLEISPTEIKYTLFNDSSGKIYSLRKSEIISIQYPDGTVDVFNETQTTTAVHPSDSGIKVYSGTGQSGQPTGSGSVQRQSTVSPEYKKGYVGLGIGSASTFEEYNNITSGTQFNINAGYLFTKHVGISASFLLTSYKVTGLDVNKLGLRGGLVGPLFTFGFATQKLEIDIRPTVGLIVGKGSDGSRSYKTNSTFGGGLCTSLRWNIIEQASVSVNFDSIFHGDLDKNTDINGLVISSSLASAGFSVGVNFRF